MSERREGFEEALAELEGIVESLEAEDLELDEALRLFERGIERLRLAASLLDSAHGRVEELIQEADGETGIVDLDLSGGDDGDSHSG
jgi:exodeoxyribonuclease VII small subunit